MRFREPIDRPGFESSSGTLESIVKRACINRSVGVGCVDLLLTLLVPAEMNSRENTRRAQCKNNLKQRGLWDETLLV